MSAVLLLILANIMAKLSRELLRTVLRYGPIDLTDRLVRKHLVEARQSLARPGEENDSADWTVDAVNNTQENIARLVILLLDISLNVVEQSMISGLVGLNNLADLLVDGDYMVILV